MPNPPRTIPGQAETLQILRLMENEPMLLLSNDDDSFGARWTLSGQQIQPAIARFLTESGYIAETGRTGLGARKLTLTAAGRQFREQGLRWWSSLNWLQKLKVTLFG